MARYECRVCGWVYDETEGCPDEGIAPGTRWVDVPDDWCCPTCGASKDDFDMIVVADDAATPYTSVAEVRNEASAAALVIIGSGLAAYTLAREFRKIDRTSSLMLLTRDGGGYYAKPSLSNALASRRTPEQLQTRSAQQMAAELDAQIRVRCEVLRIDPASRRLHLGDGSQLAYERLVIACGADPIRLTFGGDGAEAVQSVNDLDDYSRFHASLEGAHSVVVIGAGLIGCEFANDLASRQIKAVLVDPAAWPLSRLLPEEAGRYFIDGLQAEGVEFRLRTSVRDIWKAASGYRLELADGQEIVADRILSAIGLRPRTALAQAAGIVCQRGIVANRQLETSIAGIYALGDCAEIAGLNLPFVLPIMHQAAALARTLAGEPTELRYPAMPVTVKTPACPSVVCPPAPGAQGSWTCQTMDGGGGLQACFAGPDGTLLGFALMGKATQQSQGLAARLSPTLA